MNPTYDKIEAVIGQAGKALAPHEFDSITMRPPYEDLTGKAYIGQSESTIARRMREMVVLGRLYSQRREGRGFKEFGLRANGNGLDIPGTP